MRSGTIEVRFTTKEEARLHTTTTNVTLLPTYMDRRNVRGRIGRVLAEIKSEWLMTAVIAAKEENAKMVSVRRTIILNWWSYSLETRLFATFKDIEKLPFEIEMLGENTFKVMVHYRTSNCYSCSGRSYMKV